MKDMPPLATDRARALCRRTGGAVAADNDTIAEEAPETWRARHEELLPVTDPIGSNSPESAGPVHRQSSTAYKNARRNVRSNRPTSSPTVNGPTAILLLRSRHASFELINLRASPLGFHGLSSRTPGTSQINDDGRVEIWASNKAPRPLCAAASRRDLGLTKPT